MLKYLLIEYSSFFISGKNAIMQINIDNHGVGQYKM